MKLHCVFEKVKGNIARATKQVETILALNCPLNQKSSCIHSKIQMANIQKCFMV